MTSANQRPDTPNEFALRQGMRAWIKRFQRFDQRGSSSFLFGEGGMHV